MDIANLYEKYLKHPQITTDSRSIPENSIFFALKGENFDGNKFVLSALEQGAVYAVISDEKYSVEGKTILVEDTLKTLQELAKYHREKISTKIIGITGTNGKTTTKELITKVLSKKYKTYSTQGNFNNHIGVPLTLLAIDKDTDFAVVEMGANHFGEIADLCELAKPNIGLITNIGKAHIAGFGSIENIIATKLQLFEAVKKNNGVFLINSNDKIIEKKTEKYEKSVKYGKSETSIISVEKIYNSTLLKIEVKVNAEFHTIQTNLIGKYNSDNVLAAFAVGLTVGIDAGEIVEAIEEYLPSNNRSELKKTERNTLILDMYNANPTSMKLAVCNFAENEMKNKILIVGDMLELGENEINEHQEIINIIKKYNFDEVFLIGGIFKKCNFPKNFYAFDNVSLLNNYLKENEITGHSILLKASNGIGLKKCVTFF